MRNRRVLISPLLLACAAAGIVAFALLHLHPQGRVLNGRDRTPEDLLYERIRSVHSSLAAYHHAFGAYPSTQQFSELAQPLLLFAKANQLELIYDATNDNYTAGIIGKQGEPTKLSSLPLILRPNGLYRASTAPNDIKLRTDGLIVPLSE